MHFTNYSKTHFYFDPTDNVGEKGVIYFLGTNGYTVPYRFGEDDYINRTKNTKNNSHVDKRGGFQSDYSSKEENRFNVKVQFSKTDIGEPFQLLTKTPQDIYLGMTDGTYIDIEFPCKFKPNYYSIWNTRDSHRSGFALFNWRLLGWDEQKEEWIVLREHKDDTTIQRASFARGDFEVNCDGFYNLFRILSTGHNQWGSHPGLMISTVEFYGQIYQNVLGDKIMTMKDKEVKFLFV